MYIGFLQQLSSGCGELLHLAPHPAVICVEKPYLGGFVEGFEAWPITPHDSMKKVTG